MQRLLALFLGSAWLPALAPAATPIPTTAAFSVNAAVSAGCLVVGNPSQTSGVGFGMLDFGSHAAIASGTSTASLGMNAGNMAQIQCTPGTAATVTLDGGQHAQGSQRRMKFGSSSYLPYTLYTSPSLSTPLPPNVGVAVDTSAGTMTLPVYGVATLPGGGLPAGQYTDTVQVLFSW